MKEKLFLRIDGRSIRVRTALEQLPAVTRKEEERVNEPVPIHYTAFAE
jgi:hypothetical protein